jgi:hypothetical protein
MVAQVSNALVGSAAQSRSLTAGDQMFQPMDGVVAGANAEAAYVPPKARVIHSRFDARATHDELRETRSAA